MLFCFLLKLALKAFSKSLNNPSSLEMSDENDFVMTDVTLHLFMREPENNETSLTSPPCLWMQTDVLV